MVNRALAAEIRHESKSFTALVEKKLGRLPGSLGSLTSVQCEATAKLDLLLDYASQGSSVTVGLESKLDHEVTRPQLKKQRKVVDHLVLVCPDPAVAEPFDDLLDAVLTWDEVLSTFKNSRLTATDIDSFPLSKVATEKLLRDVALPALRLPSAWRADVKRGGSAMPSIVIVSPPLPDGRELRGQIQVAGRGMKPTLAETRFEYHIGVQVDDSAEDFPKAEATKTAPGWIPHLLVLHSVVDALGGRKMLVGKYPGQAGGGEHGANKLPLVVKFLPKDGRWLARGYCNWALGIKSGKLSSDRLEDLARTTAKIFRAWYKAETNLHKGPPTTS